MPATYNDTTDKLESAAQAIIAALEFARPRTVNTGVDDDNYALPNVICSVEEGNEYPLKSGNFWVRLRLTVNSAIGLSRVEHLNDFRIVHDTFFAEDIDQVLSAAVGNFFVQGIRERTQGRTIKEKAHSHFIECELLACSTTLEWPEATNLEAVTNFDGTQVSLTWESSELPATVPEGATWQIFRDGELVGEVASNVFAFTDDTSAVPGDHEYTIELHYE